MRKFTSILFLLLVFVSMGLTGEITSFADAKAQALKLEKPLLIDFMTEW